MNMKIAAYKAAIEMLPVLANAVSWAKCTDSCEESLDKLYAAYKPKEIFFAPLAVPENPIDLSFIVPVYNAHAYLSKCVGSLVRQNTKYTYEIILVNDGSTDDSADLIFEYAEKYPIIRAYHQKNAGISAARNRGIQEAKGRYLVFVDNDDYVTEDYVEKLLDRAYRTDADMVKCGHYRWDVQGKRALSVNQYEDASYCGDMGADILKLKGFVWEGVSKRTLWTDYRFPEGYWYEDMITRFVLMRKAQRIEVTSDVMYYYCMHKTNASKSVWKSSELKCLDEVYLLRSMMDIGGGGTSKQTSYALLYELGGVLWSRTRQLPAELKRAVFSVGAQLLCDYVSQNADYSGEEAWMLGAYYNRSYLSWQLLALRQMLKVKLKNDCGV